MLVIRDHEPNAGIASRSEHLVDCIWGSWIPTVTSNGKWYSTYTQLRLGTTAARRCSIQSWPIHGTLKIVQIDDTCEPANILSLSCVESAELWVRAVQQVPAHLYPYFHYSIVISYYCLWDQNLPNPHGLGVIERCWDAPPHLLFFVRPLSYVEFNSLQSGDLVNRIIDLVNVIRSNE